MIGLHGNTGQFSQAAKRRFRLMTPAARHHSHGRAAFRDLLSLPEVSPSPSATEESIRAQLAAEIREQTEQFVAALSLEEESLRSRLAKRGISADSSFEHIQSLVAGLVDGLEHIARSQQPPPIEEIGLEQALEMCCQQLCEHASLELAYESQINDRAIDPSAALVTFRIAQDALSYAAKYRKPSFVSVKLTQEGADLHLRVEDMGELEIQQDSSNEAAERAFLRRMDERAAKCEARLQITHGAGATALTVALPAVVGRSARAA